MDWLVMVQTAARHKGQRVLGVPLLIHAAYRCKATMAQWHDMTHYTDNTVCKFNNQL